MSMSTVTKVVNSLNMEDDVKAAFIEDIGRFYSRVTNIEEELERIKEISLKNTYLLIGRQNNGKFEPGIIFKIERIERDLKVIKAGVWTIVILLITTLVKIIFFGGL